MRSKRTTEVVLMRAAEGRGPVKDMRKRLKTSHGSSESEDNGQPPGLCLQSRSF